MTAHQWLANGNGDDGKRRYTCSVCRVGKTWPEADRECGYIYLQDARARPVGAPRTPTAPRPHELYAGPYTTERKTCGRCGVAYLRPERMGQSRYCGPTCSEAATREVRRRSGLKTRPRKIAWTM